MKPEVKLLDRAIQLTRERGLAQKWFATNKAGRPVLTTSPEAVCHCAMGFLNVARLQTLGFDFNACEAQGRIENARRDRLGGTISDWNDTPGRTIDDVRGIFTYAREAFL